MSGTRPLAPEITGAPGCQSLSVPVCPSRVVVMRCTAWRACAHSLALFCYCGCAFLFVCYAGCHSVLLFCRWLSISVWDNRRLTTTWGQDRRISRVSRWENLYQGHAAIASAYVVVHFIRSASRYVRGPTMMHLHLMMVDGEMQRRLR